MAVCGAAVPGAGSRRGVARRTTSADVFGSTRRRPLAEVSQAEPIDRTRYRLARHRRRRPGPKRPDVSHRPVEILALFMPWSGRTRPRQSGRDVSTSAGRYERLSSHYVVRRWAPKHVKMLCWPFGRHNGTGLNPALGGRVGRAGMNVDPVEATHDQPVDLWSPRRWRRNIMARQPLIPARASLNLVHAAVVGPNPAAL